MKLILPEEKYWKSFQEGLEELKTNPTPYDILSMKNGLNYDNFEDYNLDCENNRLGIGLKEGYVASTKLWLIDNDKFVGIFDLRHSLTENLKKEGGNIAYYIIPSARRKGFASAGLKLCCEYARKILRLEKVLVTCNAKNVASYNTIKKVMAEFGGFEDEPIQFTNKEKKRVWINTMLAK